LPKLVEQIFIGNALLTKILSKRQVTFNSGLKIAQPVVYGRLAGGSFKGLDPFDISYKETQSYAEWDWKSTYVNVTIPGDDLAKSEGDEKIVGLVQSKMETATMSMHEDIENMFFGDGTGNSSKDFDGLKNAIDNGTLYGTYGGIASRATTNNWWAAQMETTGGALTLDAINTMLGLCTVANKKPDLIITTQTLYDKAWARVN